MDDELLAAVIAERTIERNAKRRLFSDRDFWSAYVSAINRRRAAVDAYLKTHPSDEPHEAETRSLEL